MLNIQLHCSVYVKGKIIRTQSKDDITNRKIYVLVIKIAFQLEKKANYL